MAKLPGEEDLGRTPTADGSRPIAVADTSGFARGEAAWAKGVSDLGKGFVSLGEDTAAVSKLESSFEYSRANSDWLVKSTELRSSLERDTDYPTLTTRYETEAKKRRDDSAALITSPYERDRFIQNSDVSIAQGVEGMKTRVSKMAADANGVWVNQTNNKLIDQGVATDDPEERTKYIDAAIANIEARANRGEITRADAFRQKQEFAHQYALADGIVRSQRDPQGVLNELQAAPGSGEGVTNRILRVEGYGKNGKSSATGAGQFIDSTWLDVLKRNMPELAAGRSDEDLLALRADKKLGAQMTDIYRQENAAALQRQGIDPTPGNQYLAHFLGAGGAAAMIKADPNMPAVDALAAAVGAKKAQQMVDANPTILNSLAGNVRSWADGKMGGSGGHEPIYNFLPPAMRGQLAQHAQVELDKQTATDVSTFKTSVEDSLAEASRNGFATKPVGKGEFIRTLGYKQGLDAYEEYTLNMKLHSDVSQVARMNPQQQAELVKSYDPKAGEEGFATQTKRQGQLQAAIVKVRKERDEDPAQFAITRIPSVQEAWGSFATVMSDPTVTIEGRQAAARDFFNKTLLEQQKAGVAATDVKVLPSGYVDGLKARLDNPQAAGGTANVVKQLQNEATLWGENWPTVYRQIAKDVGPLVRVIGSGVPELPSRILAELAPQKFADILKNESEEKAATVKKDVLTAFKPFLTSMAGNEGTISVFDDFRAQGEKLSAYYVVHGMTSSEASARAFKELIGDRYEFKDNWRAPKGLPEKIDSIQAGARTAIKELDKLDILPPADKGEGFSEKYRLDRATSAIARDGKWVTAPDESGLALIYKDEAVMRRDGKPLILRWSQLGAMGDRVARDTAAFYDALGTASTGIPTGNPGPGPI